MNIATVRLSMFRLAPRWQRDPVRVASVVITCAATAVAVGAIAWPAGSIRDVVIPNPETRAALPSDTQAQTEPEIRVTDLMARPLFRRDRKPGLKPPPPPDPGEQQRVVQEAEERRAALRKYRLSGTVLTKGYKAAILAQANDPKMRLLRVGDDLDGWEVVDISQRAVRLRLGDETVQLVFPAPTSPTAPQVTAAAPSAR